MRRQGEKERSPISHYEASSLMILSGTKAAISKHHGVRLQYLNAEGIPFITLGFDSWEAKHVVMKHNLAIKEKF